MRICIAGSRGHLDYVFDELPLLPGLRVAGIHAGDAAELYALRRLCAGVGAGWAELLDAEKHGIAVVCGPFEEHAAMCLEAFARGIHVFC
jgi:predicted dehydrogenase